MVKIAALLGPRRVRYQDVSLHKPLVTAWSHYILHCTRATFIPKQINIFKQYSTNDMCCEAQARVRQGSARDGPQGERPKSLNPSLELTLKLVTLG